MSFEVALLHYNLEEIKTKLDTVIERQKEMIINQERMIAQNKEILKQNQDLLGRLAMIENNTYYASQYAEIAANNAKACAWFGMANFMRK